MIRETPGAVPVGYEIQRLTLSALGYSTFSARLPSELFSVLALAGILLVAREIRLHSLVFLGLLWAFIPLQLRYAVEGRPYSESLFFSIASTLFLFRLIREPRMLWALFYAASVVAGIYTQPYSLLLQIGLVIPLLLDLRTSTTRRTLLICFVSLVGAGLLFAPWLLWSGHQWSVYAEQTGQNLHMSAKLPLVLLREFSGGGYVCSLSLLGFVAVGCTSQRMSVTLKYQLLGGTISCVLLAIVGDLVFHYFFAIRQVIFVLVPLCLLAAEGWTQAAARWGAYPRVLLLVPLIISALVKDARYFRDHSENWASAAQRLSLKAETGCVLYPPRDSSQFYEFFQPRLRWQECQPDRYAEHIFVPVTKYTPAEGVRQTSERLALMGYQYQAEEVHPIGETIEIHEYKKDHAPGRTE
jgi:hypothetical protein